MIQDSDPLPAKPAMIMTHELGHSFGFQHDDEIGPCECDEMSPTNCIMWSSVRLVAFASSLRFRLWFRKSVL